MAEQTTWVEPICKRPRKLEGPRKIAKRVEHLADWHKANKPDVRSIRITADDAYSLRQLWAKKDGKGDGERECRMAGFNVSPGGEITWKQFDLIEMPG